VPDQKGAALDKKERSRHEVVMARRIHKRARMSGRVRPHGTEILRSPGKGKSKDVVKGDGGQTQSLPW